MKANKLIPRMWILISLLFTIHNTAQNNIVGYEYAFNDGEGLQYVSVSPTPDFNLVTDIDVSALTNDVNTFHLRFLDENGLWSPIISKIFVKPASAFTTASTIVGYEYGFDDDGPPTYVSISPTADFNLVTNFDVSILTNDVNVFYIRFKDDIGQWSSMISKIFVKPPEAFANASTIVGYEYAFDNDNPPTYVPITPTAEFNLVTDIDVSTLTNDVNVFYIRFQDDIGLWSSIISKIFVKPPEAFATASTIVGYEYGFDDDVPPTYVPITPTADFNLVTDIEVSALPNEVNTFHIRFKDDIGQWSSIISKIFVKPPDPEDLTGNKLTSLEYWFDNDSSNIFTIDIDPDTVNYTLTEVSVSHLWQGEHTLHTQFKDTFGQYSLVMTDTINKSVLPIADFIADVTSICVGETVNFTNNSIDFDTVNWDFDDGEVSSDLNPSHTFNTSGSFDVGLLVTDSGSGLDSLITQSIQVHEYPLNTVTLDTYPTLMTADQTGATYQWINCTNGNTPIDGETNQTFTPTIDGDYAVQVTLNECTVISDCITMGNLSVTYSNWNELINIYPNPTEDILNVKTEIPLLVEFYNLNGIKVSSYEVALGVNLIDLTNLSSGLYILKVSNISDSSDNNQFIYKLIKD